MTNNIEQLMAKLDNDIKLNVYDEEKLKNLTELFIQNQLEDIKSVKINNVYKNLNNILRNICKKIATKFDINECEINEIIENNLFNINLRVEKEQNNTDIESNNDSENDSENECDNDNNDISNLDEEENKKSTKKNKKPEKFSTICIHFMENKNEACGRDTKPGTNYCGYHKKYIK